MKYVTFIRLTRENLKFNRRRVGDATLVEFQTSCVISPLCGLTRARTVSLSVKPRYSTPPTSLRAPFKILRTRKPQKNANNWHKISSSPRSYTRYVRLSTGRVGVRLCVTHQVNKQHDGSVMYKGTSVNAVLAFLSQKSEFQLDV